MEAHHFLSAALKVAPPKTHPPQPFHGGGPALKVDAEAYVVAALWLADRAAPHVDPRDQKAFDEWVALARHQLAVGRTDTSKQAKIFLANASKVSRIPTKIGCWAAHEAGNWAWRSLYAGGAARPAAANWARFLLKKSPEDLPAYLIDLDAYCIHLDTLTALRERNQTTSVAITETLWRGIKDGKIVYRLMRLANKRLALSYKQKTRWQLVEGERDDVLATVAEDHFEDAVRAVLG